MYSPLKMLASTAHQGTQHSVNTGMEKPAVLAALWTQAMLRDLASGWAHPQGSRCRSQKMRRPV